MVRLNRFDATVFAVLALVMLATRTHSLSNLVHLPDTSLASFFVGGFLLRRAAPFAALFGLAFAIDVTVIGVLGGSDFCFTPAYAMLVPAYGVMWLAGRFSADRFGMRLSAIAPTVLFVVMATIGSELLSSGGFYFLGGRFADPTLAGFLPRLTRYAPMTLLATLGWTAFAAAACAALVAVRPDLRRTTAA